MTTIQMRTCDHVLQVVHPRAIFKTNLAYFRKCENFQLFSSNYLLQVPMLKKVICPANICRYVVRKYQDFLKVLINEQIFLCKEMYGFHFKDLRIKGIIWSCRFLRFFTVTFSQFLFLKENEILISIKIPQCITVTYYICEKIVWMEISLV